MSSFVTGVYGSLGCGKSLYCVSFIANALKFNPKETYITTNIALNYRALSTWCGYDVRPFCNYVNLIDCDFNFTEGTLRGRVGSRRSVIVFDELAEFFNQWSASSPRVRSLLSWLRHSSKKGQEVFLITQEPSFINKDLRLLCFQWVRCMGYRFIPPPFCYLFFWLPYVYSRRYDNKGNGIFYSGKFTSFRLYGQFYDTSQTISTVIQSELPDFKDDFKRSYFWVWAFEIVFWLVLFAIV